VYHRNDINTSNNDVLQDRVHLHFKYHNGVKCGHWRYYDPYGNVVQHFRYKNGKRTKIVKNKDNRNENGNKQELVKTTYYDTGYVLPHNQLISHRKSMHNIY